MNLIEDSRARFGAVVVLLACCDLATAQHMWTVDDNGPADFTTIQDAVNAAADGDVVRVFAGTYDGFQVSGKGVTVLGDSATPPQLHGVVRVVSTTAGQTVVLSGLAQVPWLSINQFAGLTVAACAGSVRVQDCTWMGQESLSSRGFSGVRVENSIDVILTNCAATGGRGGEVSSGQYPYNWSTPYGGGHAIEAVTSQCAVWGGNATAGLPDTSVTVYYLSGAEGGSGAYLEGSFFFASGTPLKGGQGGKHSLIPSYCVQANGAGSCGNAGAGLRFESATSSAYVQDPHITAGTPGTTNCSSGGYYTPGHLSRPIVNHSPGSSATRVPSVTRTLTAPAFAAGTTAVTLTAAGLPGDVVYAVVDGTTHFQYDATLAGVWSLSYPPQHAAIPDAVIPGSGSVSFPVTLPAVPVTQDAELHFVQLYVVDVNTTVFVSSPRAVTLAH